MNISLVAEPIFHIGAFPVTNSLLVGVSVTAILGVFAIFVRTRKLQPVPTGLQNFSEAVVEGALTFMESVTNDRDKARKFLPLVATIFFFVLLSNWFGLLPGVGSIGLWEEHHGETILVPFFRSASADLNGTVAIALASVIGTQLFGIAVLGFFKHAAKYINIKDLVLHFSFEKVAMFFVGLIELVSEVAKVVSFSFRLFGNVFAGEVLLIVMFSLVPFIAPLPFLFLEIFVGAVQALVFSLLTLVFLTIATVSHEAH